MPRVLIIGATGYIGRALALSLLRSGTHTVYGLARSPAKARALAADEIVPVDGAGFPSSPEALLAAVRTHRIDVVVLAGADDAAGAVLDAVLSAGEERAAAYARAGVASPPKLGFVYTSGTWVHGSSIEPVSDLDPAGYHSPSAERGGTSGKGDASAAASPNAPTPLVVWRADFEKRILAPATRATLDVAVVRSALAYGRSHAIWTSFFTPVLEAARRGSGESVDVPLDARSRPALVHVDDVASGLHAVVDRLPLLAGCYPVFDLAGGSEEMGEVFGALARELGFRGEVRLTGAGDNAFAAAMSVSGNVGSERARALLGWAPKRAGLVDGMRVYAKAFEASV